MQIPAVPSVSTSPVKHKMGKNDPSRSSSTMFATNYATNLGLSQMADHKAHLLIGLNLFLLSFVIAKKHMEGLVVLDIYLIPNLLLIISCIVTIVLALLVARPVLSAKNKPGEPVNWFFFGSFRHYSVEEFHYAVFDLQHDKQALYEAMSRDLYWMGKSLARKYRLLTTAYKVFLYCQMTTAISYFICFAWNNLH